MRKSKNYKKKEKFWRIKGIIMKKGKENIWRRREIMKKKEILTIISTLTKYLLYYYYYYITKFILSSYCCFILDRIYSCIIKIVWNQSPSFSKLLILLLAVKDWQKVLDFSMIENVNMFTVSLVRTRSFFFYLINIFFVLTLICNLQCYLNI